MAETHAESVDAYFARQPEVVQQPLARVRAAVRKALPGAVEVIRYQIPTFELKGTAVLYLAAWKQHFSIYPTTTKLIDALGAELEPYRFPKDTLRFRWSEPIPVPLIERIAALRAEEVLERAGRKPTSVRAKAAGAKRIAKARPTKQRIANERPGTRRVTKTQPGAKMHPRAKTAAGTKRVTKTQPGATSTPTTTRRAKQRRSKRTS